MSESLTALKGSVIIYLIMDISGSMDEDKKKVAKRYFDENIESIRKKYPEDTPVMLKFIHHHTSANFVEEVNFYDNTETGGTVVSTALRLMITDHLNMSSQSCYDYFVLQASDGDNWQEDSSVSASLIERYILPAVRGFCYAEIISPTYPHQSLWNEYRKVHKKDLNRFYMVTISPEEIDLEMQLATENVKRAKEMVRLAHLNLEDARMRHLSLTRKDK